MGYEDLIGEIQLVLLQVKNIAKDSEYFLRLFDYLSNSPAIKLFHRYIS